MAEIKVSDYQLTLSNDEAKTVIKLLGYIYSDNFKARYRLSDGQIATLHVIHDLLNGDLKEKI